ncbi:MarR family transcriptional regulator [Acidaminobacter sp. JC074]|uniref:MarR family winged helix-turn-helix transcriptional regulator n=1 Tax=Acidaminobacter sp. JC074 TaxID=2530199 RepID=UPI001F0E92F0|nr:MarR family transcriptional regulator [Acidaminobacter sp. JC074]MCH4886529.1 MarR family transcriptional regulator [Acidaminobacter sp. JC074]
MKEVKKFSEHDMEHIMYMRAQMEHLFFRGFIKEYDLPKGVKQSHAITMIILYFHPNESMSKLSKGLNMEKGSITTVVDKLVKLGYAVSERSTSDRRVYHINLTETGMAFAKKFTSDHKAYIGSLMDQLDQESRDEFFKAAGVISKTLERLGADFYREKCDSK